MNGLLPDINFIGQFRRLMYIIQSDEWRDIGDKLGLRISSFSELKLDRETPDRQILDVCQSRGLILITGNRNHDGPDSLEAAIADTGSQALPVITIGSGQRVQHDSRYARMIAVDLLEVLIDLREIPESLLGAGRIYLPRGHLPA